MPTKGKDKKNAKQADAPNLADFTRRPLPPVEPIDARQAPRVECPVVSAHHKFEEWESAKIGDEDWGLATAPPFQDPDNISTLPARMFPIVAAWVRAEDLLSKNSTTDNAHVRENGEHAGGSGGKGKAAGADKGKGKQKGKDKGNLAIPVKLEDTVMGEDGNSLCRVFVPRQQPAVDDKSAGATGDVDNGAVAGPQQESSCAGDTTEDARGHAEETTRCAASGQNTTGYLGKELPRGFRQGWSSAQLDCITNFFFQQQQGREEGGREVQQASTPGESDLDDGTNSKSEEGVEDNGGRANGLAEEAFGFLDPSQGGNSVPSPEILPEETLEELALGTPAGGDVDPIMTGVFKAICQLSMTCGETGVPLLWEAIYPQTVDKVPCRSPSGRYLVRLFAAGYWKKVVVDDSVPVDATRSPVIATSEDPVELWPLILTKALYKLYRLGGYGVASDLAAFGAGNDDIGSLSSSAAALSVAGHQDEMGRARFVAFGLHSLTGWIPSVGWGIPSTEAALEQGTPELSPEDLELPNLPPVDEEEEAARERLEERRRRQACFLHKKRRHKKVERKVISMEERLEVHSARRWKMEAVRRKVLTNPRRQVYVICMPGEAPAPVLAVCPFIASLHMENPSIGGGVAVAEEIAAPEKSGFLLEWETGQVGSESLDGFGCSFVGRQMESTSPSYIPSSKVGSLSTAEAASPASPASAPASPAPASASAPGSTPTLPTPTLRWVTRAAIEQSGGVVVAALTKLDKPYAANVQCHWSASPAASSIPETSGSAASGKGAKGKGGKGKAGKSRERKESSLAKNASDQSVILEEDRPPSLGTSSWAESKSARMGGRPKGTKVCSPGCAPAIFLRVHPSPRPRPTPDIPPNSSGLGSHEDQIISDSPEKDSNASATTSEADGGGGAAEVLEAGAGGGATVGYLEAAKNNPENDPGTSLDNDLESDRGVDGDTVEQADRATDFRHPHGLHHHVSALSSSNILKTEQQQGVDDKENEEQEEEAEIAMCLWVDQPGSGAGDDLVTKGRARAVLQEVRSRGNASDILKPAPAGGVILRARYNPDANGLPIMVVSTKIRLLKGGAPRVYRVILQPGLGCCVGFCSTHDIGTGEAGKVWEDAGFSQVTQRGEYEGSRAGEWRILFRCAFSAPDVTSETLEEDNNSNKNTDKCGTVDSNADVDEALEHVTSMDNNNNNNNNNNDNNNNTAATEASTFVTAILHLPVDPSSSSSSTSSTTTASSSQLLQPLFQTQPSSVYLVLVDHDTEEETRQPSLHTKAMAVRPNRNGYTLLAAVYSRRKDLPKGHWYLQLLSDRPLLPPKTSPLSFPRSPKGCRGGSEEVMSVLGKVACGTRSVYGGVYVPNKYFVLFRDILTCSVALPVAARLRCSLPTVRLRLTFIDAGTCKVMRIIKGSQILQAFSISPPLPSPPKGMEDGAPPHAAARDSTGKSGGKRGGGVGRGMENDLLPGKMIVEAAIDWESMQVPHYLASPLPYYYEHTPENFPHFVPPEAEASSTPDESAPLRSSSGNNNSNSSSRSSISMQGVAKYMELSAEGEATAAAASTAVLPLAASHDSEELRWWLEIIAAGEVEMAHDSTKVNNENMEMERWEAAEPGRAGRAALLWTQKQAAKVAETRDGVAPGAAATDGVGGGGAGGGDEEWIKARAAAVGVPMELEKDRQASRAALPPRAAPERAPSDGSNSSSGLSPGKMTDNQAVPPPPVVVLLGSKELRERADKRALLKVETEEFVKNWEAERLSRVETGEEEMAMQLRFIHEREEEMKAARLPFLRQRETIVEHMIAEAKAKQEALVAEREAVELAAKASRSKSTKGGKGGKM